MLSRVMSVLVAGGLVLLAWYDSILVGLLVGGVLGWAWLTDWVQGAVCTSPTRLQGKLAVVTGANTGELLLTSSLFPHHLVTSSSIVHGIQV